MQYKQSLQMQYESASRKISTRLPNPGKHLLLKMKEGVAGGTDVEVDVDI